MARKYVKKPGAVNNDTRYFERLQRQADFVRYVAAGATLADAARRVGVSDSAYRKWREKDRKFAAEVDAAKIKGREGPVDYDGSIESFTAEFFGMQMSAFQIEAAQAMESTPPGNILMILFPPEHGKGQVSGTEMPTPTGWTTIDDLEVGDMLIGKDGLPTRVTEVHPWRQLDCYEVEFSDGSTVTVDGDHLWTVSGRDFPQSDRKSYGIRTIDTREVYWRTANAGRAVLRTPIAAPFDLPEIDFGTDPYLLGAWLGDGFSASTGYVCAGRRDLAHLVAQFNAAGYPTTIGAPDAAAPIVRSPRLRDEIKALGLRNDKHIPGHLLRASWSQRLALLQGLMDTDGSISRGQAEYAGVRRELVQGVYELVRTLGMKARLYEGRAKLNGEDKGPVYRVSFYPGMTPVFRLPRKASRLRSNAQGDRREWETIVAVRPVESQPTRCLRVEAEDHLYLVGRQMHVTHNTTGYENFACFKLSRNPDWRGTVASENITISRKIVSRVRSRLQSDGPYPAMVAKFGPFQPQPGVRRGQPWASDHFNVFKKGKQDERDYSMMALGYGSSIVSTRTDHLHIDDLQSTKTQNETDKMEEWFRQDALSRPGESGITTIAGTRVAEDDFYERLAEDTDLEDILRVIRLPAIITDPNTGEQRPLWPEKWTMEMLDRQRRKVGQEAWDRNYMQNPGASTRGKGTFSAEIVDRCLDPLRSINHLPTEGSIVYVGLDPALGSMNCVLAAEATPDGKLIVRKVREDINLQRNEQIMAALEQVVVEMNQTGTVTDVVVETMNFQKGLYNDERLREMRGRYGFQTREHLTGVNKYDEDIGVPSMVSSFIREEIVLPWADDPETRHEIGELRRQLLAWKPKKRGNKLRQDRVMALWFVWILWRARYKSIQNVGRDTSAWVRGGVPFQTVPSGLIIPIGARP